MPQRSRKSREPKWKSAPIVRGKLTCKAKGELGELAFVHKAASLGFGVAKPHGENEPYDFILDSGKAVVASAGEVDLQSLSRWLSNGRSAQQS